MQGRHMTMRRRAEINVTLIDGSQEFYRVCPQGTYTVNLQGIMVTEEGELGIKRTFFIPAHQIKRATVCEVD